MFETVTRDGRTYVDLRGFPLAILVNLHDSGIDFAGAKSPQNEHGLEIGIRTDDVVLTDCLFDEAQTIESVHGSFTACTFRRARMREAYLTASFDTCVFDGANLRSARFWHSTIRQCSFRSVDLLKAEMGGVTFERCDFRGARFGSGSIRGTKFLGCDLTGVDLADAFRDEETLFDDACIMDGLRYAMKTKVFGDVMDVGPAPAKRPPV
jgi:uncharacterized protein YjbI with pentapeptide repeats